MGMRRLNNCQCLVERYFSKDPKNKDFFIVKNFYRLLRLPVKNPGSTQLFCIGTFMAAKFGGMPFASKMSKVLP